MTDARYPVWTPDGDSVTFATSTPEGVSAVMSVSVAGDTPPQLVYSSEGRLIHPENWTAAGDQLIIVETELQDRDVSILGSGQEASTTPFLASDFLEDAASLSHDGKWIAYVSDVSGAQEVYVRSASGVGGETLVSTGGGQQPVWAPDDGELYYISDTDQLWAARLQTEPEFRVVDREPLFDGSRYLFHDPNRHAFFDVDPDSGRFLMVSAYSSLGGEQPKINVVLNWFEELKERVPGGR